MPGLSDALDIKRRKRMIVDLDWRETSGVDAPANLVPGWAVMKSRNGDQGMPNRSATTNPDVTVLKQLLREESVNIRNDQQLYRAVKAADLSDAPDQVQQASAILKKYLLSAYGPSVKAAGHPDDCTCSDCRKARISKQGPADQEEMDPRRRPPPDDEDDEEDDQACHGD